MPAPLSHRSRALRENGLSPSIQMRTQSPSGLVTGRGLHRRSNPAASPGPKASTTAMAAPDQKHSCRPTCGEVDPGPEAFLPLVLMGKVRQRNFLSLPVPRKKGALRTCRASDCQLFSSLLHGTLMTSPCGQRCVPVLQRGTEACSALPSLSHNAGRGQSGQAGPSSLTGHGITAC